MATFWPIVILDVLIIGLPLIFKLAQPKEINSLFGYRTKRSKQNEKTWKVANLYWTNIMLFGSVMVIAFQLVLIVVQESIPTILSATCIAWIITLIAGIFLTESFLKKTFGK